LAVPEIAVMGGSVATLANVEVGGELLNKRVAMGPTVLFTHSASSLNGYEAVMQDPNIRGINSRSIACMRYEKSRPKKVPGADEILSPNSKSIGILASFLKSSGVTGAQLVVPKLPTIGVNGWSDGQGTPFDFSLSALGVLRP
jgi:hypothetical protein